jgi:uncharacterized protein (UPF0332 family)
MNPEIEEQLCMADESLRTAEGMVRLGNYRFSVSRSYYTMFYCATALLLSQGRTFSRHGALIAAFGREFAKAGLLDAKFHEYLQKAFLARQRSDYESKARAWESEAAQALQWSREFLDATKAYLERPGSPPISPIPPSP